MPLYRDEAVVLRTHKLGEADRIVTMLSRNHGKIRAVAKGVRRTASKFGARLEPFMVADVQCYEGRSLDIITQAESLGSYGAVIADDYSSYTAATAMVETADKLTEDEGGIQQYLLLVGALRSLARHEHGPSLTLDSYLLRALSVAGWAPSFSDCAMTGAPGPHSAFVVQLGGVVADEVAPPGAPRLDARTIGLLSALLTGDWPVADAADERTRSQASGVVAAYTQFHLERGLRSLEHVDRRRESETAASDRDHGTSGRGIGFERPSQAATGAGEWRRPPPSAGAATATAPDPSTASDPSTAPDPATAPDPSTASVTATASDLPRRPAPLAARFENSGIRAPEGTPATEPVPDDASIPEFPSTADRPPAETSPRHRPHASADTRPSVLPLTPSEASSAAYGGETSAEHPIAHSTQETVAAASARDLG